MVALEHDEQHRHCGMTEHRDQHSGLIEVVLGLLEMIGKGDNERELEQLRGLEGKPHKGDPQPGHVVRPADAQHKGEPHQRIGQRQVQPPQVGHRLVVDAGDHHHGTAAQPGSHDLYDDTVQLYIVGIPDAQEHQHTEGRRKQAQPPDHLVGEFIIADNAAPDFLHLSPPGPIFREREFFLSFIISPGASRCKPLPGEFTVWIQLPEALSFLV